MAKKQNTMDKSLEAMNGLMGALGEFNGAKLKDDLVSKNVGFKENKDLFDQIDEVSKTIAELHTMVHTLTIKVKNINVEVLKNKSSRFASGKNVVHKFLTGF